MQTVMAFIKRHPVLTFYALPFALSWGGILIVDSGPRAPVKNPRITLIYAKNRFLIRADERYARIDSEYLIDALMDAPAPRSRSRSCSCL